MNTFVKYAIGGLFGAFLAVLLGFAVFSPTVTANAQAPTYKMVEVKLKPGQMMPAPVPKVLLIGDHKIFPSVDDNYSLSVDATVWIVSGPNVLSAEAVSLAWNEYRRVTLPVASLGWLLEKKLIFNACPGAPAPAPQPPSGGTQPPPAPQPPRVPAAECKSTIVNPVDDVLVATTDFIGVVEEFNNSKSPKVHKFTAFDYRKQGPLTFRANANDGLRGWRITSVSQDAAFECAFNEAKRTAYEFKKQHPDYQVFGPDGNEVR